MRNLSYFLVFLSGIFYSCQDSNMIMVKPGVGIDNLTFEYSDTSDILAYRNLVFTKEKGTSLAEGDVYLCYQNWTKYVNDSLGIGFMFSTPCFDNLTNEDSLQQFFVNVSLYKTPNAFLGETVCIGRSSTSQVLDYLGEPKNTYKQISGQVFIHYENLQLAFSNDTLNWIKVFSSQKID